MTEKQRPQVKPNSIRDPQREAGRHVADARRALREEDFTQARELVDRYLPQEDKKEDSRTVLRLGPEKSI